MIGRTAKKDSGGIAPAVHGADVTTEWIQAALRNDGFLVVSTAVDEMLLREMETDLAGSEAPSVRRRQREVFAIRHLLQQSTVIQSLANTVAFRRLVESVLGPCCRPVRATLFDKRPEANWLVPWHQDVTIAVQQKREVPGFGPWSQKAGVPHVQPPVPILEQMLAVRVHLDDCHGDNGALRVFPGSHRHGRLTDAAVEEWRARYEAQTCVVPRGGILLMHPLLLHASSAAEVPSRRRVLHLEFTAASLPGGLEWHG